MKMNSSTRLITQYLLSCLLCLPAISYATSWPTFKSPSLTFLEDNNLIDTTNCPSGEGRISPDLVLNIERYFCGRFCPGNWAWTLSDDGQCHSLADAFTFLRYQFDYFRSGEYEDEKFYTKVTAYYGNSNDGKSTFTFTFISEKDNHWQCVEMNPEYHTIICANDT